MGHEERFPLPRRVAAIGSVKGRSPKYPVTTGKRRFRPFAGPRLNRCSRLLRAIPATSKDGSPIRERTFAPDFGLCQSQAHASSPSSAFASFRSGVLKPSVNQP
jgi:hypothetical protein